MKEFDLNSPLLTFVSQTEAAFWTVYNSFEGCQIFGGIGSGKTNFSGRKISDAMINAGFGGLVLTCKPDEKQMWVDACKRAKRSKHLVILEPYENNRFNFLQYESTKSETNHAFTANIVDVLQTIINASSAKDGGRSNDEFWQNASDMLLHNLVSLLQMAYGTVTVQMMYDVAQSLPKEEEDLIDYDDTTSFEEEELSAYQKAHKIVYDRVVPAVQEWENNLPIHLFDELKYSGKYDEELYEAIPDAREFKFVDAFFSDTLKKLNSKTRSIIDFSLIGFLFRLLQQPIYSLLCNGESNVTPELCMAGKIVLINLPTKIYGKIGRDSQILIKFMFQRQFEKRTITPKSVPIFIWADEAHTFLHEKDADFQATARSSQVATVYLSQNINNYYSVMGGGKSEYRVKGFLGTMATKLFHANSCLETNKYASEIIGEDFFEDRTESSTFSGKFSQSEGKSYKLRKIMRPEAFQVLKTGGKKCGYLSEAVIHRQGYPAFFGKNYFKATFVLEESGTKK